LAEGAGCQFEPDISLTKVDAILVLKLSLKSNAEFGLTLTGSKHRKGDELPRYALYYLCVNLLQHKNDLLMVSN